MFLCEDVPIFMEKFVDHEFLFGVQIAPYMSDLRGLVRGEWDCLAEVVLQLDGHLRGLGLRHDWVRVGHGQDFLQVLEFYGCQKHVGHLAALPIAVLCTLYIPFDGGDSIWA
jgi:hypothetical protein